MSVGWDEILKELKKEISESAFSIWIKPITPRYIDESHIILSVPNIIIKEKVSKKFLPIIKDFFKKRGRLAPKIKLEITKDDRVEMPKVEQERLPLKGLNSHSPFSRYFTFKHFVTGKCNAFAYQLALSLASGEPFYNNSICLISSTGLGKSHLSQAVGNYIYERYPNAKVIYQTTEGFISEMISAFRKKNGDQFKKKYRHECDVLLLEDVHFLTGKEKTQEELAYTIDTLQRQNKKIVFTSSCYPKDIPKLNDSLVSRLCSAVISPIDPPDIETRRRIIHLKAEILGLFLSKNIVDYLAEYIVGDVRKMESALISIMAHANIKKTKKIDLALVKEITEHLVDVEEQITTDLIINVICNYFQVTREELSSKSRKRSITVPRNISMYLSRKYTNSSLKEIGEYFNRDHSTVLNAIRRVETEIKKNYKIKNQLEFLKKQIKLKSIKIDIDSL